jgi:CAAX prenyl protease-like protein
MKQETKGAIVFTGILFAYLLSEMIVSLFTNSNIIKLCAKIIIVGTLLIIYRDWFKFKLKFDLIAILTGIAIAVVWVAIDSIYPHILTQAVIPPEPFSTIEIILKLFIGIVLASLVEEFFTRYFLHRLIQAKNWLSVPLGKISLAPFIFTTLFFGFSHDRWLAGLLTGAALNLLWYKRKDMNSIVTAHAVANLVLGILVIYLGAWQFW